MSPLPRTPPDDADVTPAHSPDETAAPPDSRVTQWRGRVFTSTSPVWIFLALIVIVAVFGVMKPHEFLSSFDIKTIFINASVALMLSVGMTFVIITADIDLSVGSVLVFSGVLAAKVMIAVGGGSSHATAAGWARSPWGWRRSGDGTRLGGDQRRADRVPGHPATDRHPGHVTGT